MHLAIPNPTSNENNAIMLRGKASSGHISCLSYCIRSLFYVIKIHFYNYSLSCIFGYAYGKKLDSHYQSG